ncbi:MAG: amidohydrolase family protein [Planctomycetota bacterium]|nr:amidohydrolase family protein [Planctomycetota bacterium]
MKRFPKKATLALSLLCSALTLALPAEAGEKQAIKAGTIITMDGDPIVDGVILMDSGRIVAVGASADVEIPWDAEVTEAPDMVAVPGFVEAHSNNGMDRTNETIDMGAFFDVQDSVNPVAFYFEDSLRYGITTINIQQGNQCVVAAQGAIVKPFGATVAQQLVRPHAGLKMSVTAKRGKSRATQAAALRKAFGDLRSHLEKLVDEHKKGDDRARREALAQGRDYDGEDGKGRAMTGKGWTLEGMENIPRVEIDEKLAPLLKVVEGRMAVYMYCGSPAEVHTALNIARENGFLHRMIFVLGSGCFKAADEIAAAKVPVILSRTLVHTERDPITSEETLTFEAKVFQDKGVAFALTSNNSGLESLWYQAALCVGQGMARKDALASITTSPAKILGLENRVGVLKPGADANVVLYTGDPLSVTSHVNLVFIDGQPVYDRSKDVRLQHLMDGEQPKGTAPSDEEEGEMHAGEGPSDDDKKGEGSDSKGDK